MLGGEADVGQRPLAQRVLAGERGGELRAEPLEPVERERVEQIRLVGEVPAGRAMADAHRPRELAQGQLAAGRERLLRAVQQRGAQIAVVIGANGGALTESLNVVIDSIVVIVYFTPMSQWTATDIPDQTGRTYVITGANSGIGLRRRQALAGKGARVILAVRNPTKGAEAARTSPARRRSAPWISPTWAPCTRSPKRSTRTSTC